METRKLELKDVAAGIQHGLKCQAMGEWIDNDDSDSGGKILTVIGTYIDANEDRYIQGLYDGDHFDIYFDTDFFPIYHPITDLTKEITHKGERFVPIVELARTIIPNLVVRSTDINTTSLDFAYDGRKYRFWFDCFKTVRFDITAEGGYKRNFNQLVLFDKLNEWHFDYRGLIQAGLAIDVNTLEADPYK